jgi:uncharacterized membrane-anchored protein
MRKILILCLLLFPLLVSAKDKPAKADAAKSAEAKAEEEARKKFEAQLTYQRGKITLKDGLATLDVPAGFRYLDSQQANKILVEAWGNPPGKETLGMLFPSNVSPLQEGGWGVIITYQEDGYVKDDEAESINYDDLMKQMKESVVEENTERKKAGFDSVDLIGWAARPHYDKASHKLYWAKEVKFGDNPEHTLNYNIRALGRRGVLVLNAVSSIGQLQSVEADMNEVLKFVSFNEGHRYTDFKPGYDKIAAFGIGALIAGKVAAKVGLFKLLIGLLVAGKKLVIVALVGIGALLKKLFNRKSGEDPNSTSITG